MTTHVARSPASASLTQLYHIAAQRLDAWLARRRKSADDEVLLAGMSARELKDIGLDPGPAASRGRDDWVRDWA